MTAFSRFLTNLVVMVALLAGSAGSVSSMTLLPNAHADGYAHPAAPPHDAHAQHAPGGQQPLCPSHDQGMPMAAPCCHGLAAPTRWEVGQTAVFHRIAWHPLRENPLKSRWMAPEPPRPKTVL